MSKIHIETPDQFSINDLRITRNVKPEVLAQRAPRQKKKRRVLRTTLIFSFAQLRATTSENGSLEAWKNQKNQKFNHLYAYKKISKHFEQSISSIIF